MGCCGPGSLKVLVGMSFYPVGVPWLGVVVAGWVERMRNPTASIPVSMCLRWVSLPLNPTYDLRSRPEGLVRQPGKDFCPAVLEQYDATSLKIYGMARGSEWEKERN